MIDAPVGEEVVVIFTITQCCSLPALLVSQIEPLEGMASFHGAGGRGRGTGARIYALLDAFIYVVERFFFLRINGCECGVVCGAASCAAPVFVGAASYETPGVAVSGAEPIPEIHVSGTKYSPVCLLPGKRRTS